MSGIIMEFCYLHLKKAIAELEKVQKWANQNEPLPYEARLKCLRLFSLVEKALKGWYERYLEYQLLSSIFRTD